jgi:hypothetical protein
MANDEQDKPDPTDAVMKWHALGLSFAEIGHRLGVSPEKLREIMGAAGVPADQMDAPSTDDDFPNKEPFR